MCCSKLKGSKKSWQSTMMSLNCEELSGSVSYFVVSSESIFQPYLEFRAALLPPWNQAGVDQILYIYQSFTGELLVGHWYAKLTFNCLQKFKDHLNCNSTGKGGWKCEIKSLWDWFMKKLHTIYIGKECMKILYSVPMWFIKFLFRM